MSISGPGPSGPIELHAHVPIGLIQAIIDRLAAGDEADRNLGAVLATCVPVVIAARIAEITKEIDR